MVELQQQGGANRDVSVGTQGQNPTEAGIAARYSGNARRRRGGNCDPQRRDGELIFVLERDRSDRLTTSPGPGPAYSL